MKPNETACNSPRSTSTKPKRQTHVAKFTKILDGRKQPIRGLWKRNDRFYAQLTFEDAATGVKRTRRVPLLDKDGAAVQSVAEAKSALEKLRTQRADNSLPVLSRTPKFSDYADGYLAFVHSGALKKQGTIYEEKTKIKMWKAHLGSLRLHQIKPAHVSAFIAQRLAKKRSKRTVKLDVIALRNVLKHARDVDQHIQHLPIPPGLNRQLRSATTKRQLFTHEQLEKLCAAAFGTRTNDKGETAPVTKNAVQFVDYLRLLAYSGAREQEAIALRWPDADFERGQLTIGATGDTKNSTARVVDFNSKLETLLEDMLARRAPDSEWMFPSPQRGEKDIRAKSFRESLLLVRAKAGLTNGFHDLRHTFISFCVMSGVDFMTIAKWVGHRDGGVLIGKVYGHLADAHTKIQGKRVSFEVQTVPAAASK